MTYSVHINHHGLDYSGAHYKAQLSPFGPDGTGIYVVQAIGYRTDETEAKRECLAVAEHLVKLINDRIAE